MGTWLITNMDSINGAKYDNQKRDVLKSSLNSMKSKAVWAVRILGKLIELRMRDSICFMVQPRRVRGRPVDFRQVWTILNLDNELT